MATSSSNRSKVHARISIGVERSKLSFTSSSSSNSVGVGSIAGILRQPCFLEWITRIYVASSRTMTTTPCALPPPPTTSTCWSPTPYFILREVVAECERPVLLFSGGKDSAVLLAPRGQGLRAPATPFPGAAHRHRSELPRGIWSFATAPSSAVGARLVVARVQDTIDQGKVEDPGVMGSRNRLQTVTLLDAITDNNFDAAFGGARRDEDKARAKERILQFPRRLRPVGPAPTATRALAALSGQGEPR